MVTRTEGFVGVWVSGMSSSPPLPELTIKVTNTSQVAIAVDSITFQTTRPTTVLALGGHIGGSVLPRDGEVQGLQSKEWTVSRPFLARAAKVAPGQPRSVRAPAPRCPDCGEVLADPRRLQCPDCRQLTEASTARRRLELALARVASLEATTPTPPGSVMRVARNALNRAEAIVWDLEHSEAKADPAYYRSQILPGLQALPIAVIGEAIGVGRDSSWRIREGTLTPHLRHWDALASLDERGGALQP